MALSLSMGALPPPRRLLVGQSGNPSHRCADTSTPGAADLPALPPRTPVERQNPPPAPLGANEGFCCRRGVLGVQRDEHEIPLARFDGGRFDLEVAPILNRKLANLRHPIDGMPAILIGRTHLVRRTGFGDRCEERIDGGGVGLTPAPLAGLRHGRTVYWRSGKRHGVCCPLCRLGRHGCRPLDGANVRRGWFGCRCFCWHEGNATA